MIESQKFESKTRVFMTVAADSAAFDTGFRTDWKTGNGTYLLHTRTEEMFFSGEKYLAEVVPDKKAMTVKPIDAVGDFNIWNLRAGILRNLRRHLFIFEEHSRGVFWAILTGRREFLTSGSKRWFADAGLSHVLALSGMHILIWTAVFSVFIKKIPWPWLRFLISTTGLTFFLMLTTIPSSLLRAYLSVLLAGLFFVSGKKIRSIDLLILVFLLQCLFSPSSMAESGFWLSFSACAGIILLFPVFCKYLSFLPVKINSALSTTLAAQGFSTFLSVFLFSRFSVHALYLSVIAAFVITLLWGAGLVLLVLCMVFPIFVDFAKMLLMPFEILFDFCFLWKLPVLVLKTAVQKNIFCLLWSLPLLLTANQWLRGFFHVYIRSRQLGQADTGRQKFQRPKKFRSEFSG